MEEQKQIRRNTTKFHCEWCGYHKAIWLITEEKYCCWACGHKQVELKYPIEYHPQKEYEEANERLWKNLDVFDVIIGYCESTYAKNFPYNITGALEIFVKSPSVQDGYVILILSSATIFKEVQDFLLDNEIPLLSEKKCLKLNFSLLSPEIPKRSKKN